MHLTVELPTYFGVISEPYEILRWPRAFVARREIHSDYSVS